MLSIQRVLYRALSTTAVSVPIALIKAMRERTGAPMVECKSALAAEGNDVEKAVDWLRKKGVSIAGKKSGRTAAQGLIAVTVNEAGDCGSIVEVRRGERAR
jgi:elongation factor Ts